MGLVASALNQIQRVAVAGQNHGEIRVRKPQFLESFSQSDDGNPLDSRLIERTLGSVHLRLTTVDEDQGCRIAHGRTFLFQPHQTTRDELVHRLGVVPRRRDPVVSVVVFDRQTVFERDQRTDDIGSTEVRNITTFEAKWSLGESQIVAQILERA